MRLSLFQPGIPQNLGAAIRLTACLGVGLDVIEPCAFPFSDRSLKRAALDYGSQADISRHASWKEFLAASERMQGRLLLFTTRGEVAYTRFAYQPGDTLLFGSESAGAPDFVHQEAFVRLVIPIRPETRSLNLVTACAMALGEALRQSDP